jgi:hypothetical protein
MDDWLCHPIEGLMGDWLCHPIGSQVLVCYLSHDGHPGTF